MATVFKKKFNTWAFHESTGNFTDLNENKYLNFFAQLYYRHKLIFTFPNLNVLFL